VMGVVVIFGTHTHVVLRMIFILLAFSNNSSHHHSYIYTHTYNKYIHAVV
jgi:hypothetical protein